MPLTHSTPTTGGQAMLITVVLSLILLGAIATGLVWPIVKELQLAGVGWQSYRSYYLAEAAVEDAIWRLNSGYEVKSGDNLSLDVGLAELLVDSSGPGHILTATGHWQVAARRAQSEVRVGEGIAFHFGVNAGPEGLVIESPNAKVIGNVFSNGPISGGGGPKKIIEGSAIVAGSGNTISNITLDLDARADSIINSHISGDAWYMELSNTTVGGTKHPNTEPLATQPLPITEGMIEDWQTEAETGGILEDDYILAGQTTDSLGPIKIDGDLIIEGQATLEISGTLWVAGNIEIHNQGQLILSDSVYGTTSGVVMADGAITALDGATALGTGQTGSYLMLLSTSSGEAITVYDDADLDIIYTTAGLIVLRDTADLKEVTGYGIRLRDQAIVTYESGLANAFFSAGPSGSYTIFNWREVE